MAFTWALGLDATDGESLRRGPEEDMILYKALENMNCKYWEEVGMGNIEEWWLEM